MVLKERMLQQLTGVERLAQTTRLGRLLHHPFRYLAAIIFKDFIYPRTKKEKKKKARLFYGRMMTVILPAATDIYLTGGKSHDSEIRLARFLVRSLKEGDHFLDIGAHYGYFSLIAAELTGDAGQVMALEPASKSGAILRENCRDLGNITLVAKAISDQVGEISFYEFPNLFSEYNSINVDQFRDEKWFADFNPVKTTVATTTVNEITADGFNPAVIKIDVEGAELKVVTGGLDFLRSHSPVIAMEYLSPARGNTEHRQALALLREAGYHTFIIDKEGELLETADVEQHLERNGLESDNIIFKKQHLDQQVISTIKPD
jgi:FkbM family methyltransferase